MFDPIKMNSAIMKLMELTKALAPDIPCMTLAVKPGEDFAVSTHGNPMQNSEIIETVKEIQEMYKPIMAWETMGFVIKDGCPFPFFDYANIMSGEHISKENMLKWAEAEYMKLYSNEEEDVEYEEDSFEERLDEIYNNIADLDVNKLTELYNEIADTIRSIIPVEWDKVYLLGEVEKEQASYNSTLYYIEFESGNVIRAQDAHGKSIADPTYDYETDPFMRLCNLVLELNTCFIDGGEEAWEQLTYTLEKNGKYKAKYLFDAMHKDDGGQSAREVVWAYKTFEFIPSEGSYFHDLFKKHLPAEYYCEEAKRFDKNGDYKQAAKFYKKAFEKGYLFSSFFLGQYYQYGNSAIKQDYEKAAEWYERVTEVQKKFYPAYQQLGYVYRELKRYEDAAKSFLKAAELDDVKAMCEMGYIYYTGQGVSKDYEKSVYWCKKAALAGSAQGQSNFGYAYEHGVGVPQNYRKARIWYKKAAEQGNENALKALERLKELGEEIFKPNKEKIEHECLPDATELRRRLDILVAVDQLLFPNAENAELRTYVKINADTYCIDDGAGNDMFIVFSKDSCIIKGFDHESLYSPYSREDMSICEGIYDYVPQHLLSLLDTPEYKKEIVTFCAWYDDKEKAWYKGETIVPDEDYDESESDGFDLITLIYPTAGECFDWVVDSFERYEEASVDVTFDIIQSFYSFENFSGKSPVIKSGRTKSTLLNPKEFEIDCDCDYEDEEKCIAACERLVEKWTPELETQMLEAFIKFYYSSMYKQWGPDDEEESKEYWPKIKSPKDLIKHTGKNVTIYALEDGIYAKSKTNKGKYESQNVDVCVILLLKCPWEEEHGWAAVFVDEKFLTVGTDIVDCVYVSENELHIINSNIPTNTLVLDGASFPLDDDKISSRAFIFESDDNKGKATFSFDAGFKETTDADFIKKMYDVKNLTPRMVIASVETEFEYETLKKSPELLVGFNFEIDDIEKIDEREDMFYLYEHEPYENYRYEITEVKDRTVRVQCSGVAIIDGYSEPYKTAPFEMDCWLSLG